MSDQHSHSPHLLLREAVEGDKTRYYISDGGDEARFTKYKEGLFCRGDKKAGDAVKRCGDMLRTMGLNQSTLDVMTAIAENQGNLDSVYLWNDSYLSFGMFQWAVGPGSDPGSLAALLARVKEADPNIFNTYYGQYGLDVQPLHSLAGYLSLNGEVLKLPGQKNRLRNLEWAFQFWKSGREPLIQAIQIRQALCRIDTFYRSRRYAANGHSISELITSEYGVGLVLDHHVIRPGYVKPCLEEALKQTKLPHPHLWGTNEEMRFIKAYLAIRAQYGKYPMTDAQKRAAVVKKYLDNGNISAERDSFIYGIQTDSSGACVK